MGIAARLALDKRGCGRRQYSVLNIYHVSLKIEQYSAQSNLMISLNTGVPNNKSRIVLRNTHI